MKPKMILFDYGQTLVVEPQFDAKLGYAAVYDSTDGGNVSREAFCDFADAFFLALVDKAHKNYHELDNVKFLAAVCNYFDMKPSISFEEADLLYWDTATHGSHASENAAKLLDALAARNIRSGIISNLSFARRSLEARLARYLPDNKFELVVTSSDLLVRKPEHFIFDYALRKAGLSPNEVWFVGDNRSADALGAYNAGMRPILYTGAHMNRYDAPLEIPHTAIDNLIDIVGLLDEA